MLNRYIHGGRKGDQIILAFAAEDSANLPDPDVIAAEIVEDLQAALGQL